MELYILDGLLRRTEVVDKFESLIWTERWSDIGDFELRLKSTPAERSRFVVGTRLAINNSMRVMTVETVEDRVDHEGRAELFVKGRSIEAILDDRMVGYAMALGIDPTWNLTGTPREVVEQMFDHICRPPGALSQKDEIPFLMPGSIFAPGTVPEPLTPIDWTQRPETLYRAIKTVCKLYDLGFRFVRNFDTSQLYFDVYTGNDRTTRQTQLSPVVFAVGLDNIENTTELMTVEKSKNVAYVISNVGNTTVYGENVDPDVEGFERRVAVVTTQISEDHPNISAALNHAGREALRRQRALSLFDGEVNQRTEFTYGVDYDLGDLVEMRNKDGVVSYKRVTEQIFVTDELGERAYPTLALDMYTGENTWLSWHTKNKTWTEFDQEHWADM